MFKSLAYSDKKAFVSFAVFLFFLPALALAYVGPGAGLTLLGSLLGFIFAILFVLIGIVSWPLRVIWRRFFAKKISADNSASSSGSNRDGVHETAKETQEESH